LNEKAVRNDGLFCLLQRGPEKYKVKMKMRAGFEKYRVRMKMRAGMKHHPTVLLILKKVQDDIQDLAGDANKRKINQISGSHIQLHFDK
jgi:hypothetical protein